MINRASQCRVWGRLRGGAEQFKLLDDIPRQNFRLVIELRLGYAILEDQFS